MNEIISDGTNIDDIKSPDDLLTDPFAGHTPFAAVYNCFLGKITDDMYMELTPEDTVKDLQTLLIHAIPGFEFPRKVLDDFIVNIVEKPIQNLNSMDFVIGYADLEKTKALVEQSYFESKLSNEEINILALLMLQGWVQRQVTSIEVTRMKYSGPDFKMTSQANHLSRLLSLLTNVQQQSLHMQRLYKRRKVDSKTGEIKSNWSILREVNTFDN